MLVMLSESPYCGWKSGWAKNSTFSPAASGMPAPLWNMGLSMLYLLAQMVARMLATLALVEGSTSTSSR